MAILALIGDTYAVKLAKEVTADDYDALDSTSSKPVAENKFVKIKNHSERGSNSMRRYKVDQ